MAAWTAPLTRVYKFAPLVTCSRLTVLALDPCRVLAGAAVDITARCRCGTGVMVNPVSANYCIPIPNSLVNAVPPYTIH